MRKHFNFISMFVLVIVLIGCQKSAKDITLADYIGAEKEQNKEIISKELSFKAIDTIDMAIERYKKTNKLDEFKNNNIIWILEEQRKFFQKLEPRKNLYDIACANLKERLKFPNSAKLPQVDLIDNDELSISKDTTMKEGEYYIVTIKYQAQNGLGIYIDGLYKSYIKRDSSKKLIEWIGLDY
ncbi:hypothetical protein D9V86_09885 [Bacteroidetes/Chlorobi group bacterium ChocPot_Mid]|nr:MAG: hypothetical protein D9V86_09885 [Bacteroidetes/Chlorobi group bacterium ChocPot_Mid]